MHSTIAIFLGEKNVDHLYDDVEQKDYAPLRRCRPIDRILMPWSEVLQHYGGYR